MLGTSKRFVNTRAVPRLIQQVRGLKFDSKSYSASKGFAVYSEELERDILEKCQHVAPANKVFVNVDGTARSPSDDQLKNAASLGALADQPRASFIDQFKMNSQQRELWRLNSAVLAEYANNGRRILDKIPVEDPKTGEVTWTIIREKQKEGWENLMYYGYVPGLLIALGFALFLDKQSIGDWAVEELRLRAQERFNDTSKPSSDLSAEELKNRDALMVERIISGDYDRLAGLRKAGSDMPSSLL